MDDSTVTGYGTRFCGKRIAVIWDVEKSEYVEFS
jgi:hypothetical protein